MEHDANKDGIDSVLLRKKKSVSQLKRLISEGIKHIIENIVVNQRYVQCVAAENTDEQRNSNGALFLNVIRKVAKKRHASAGGTPEQMDGFYGEISRRSPATLSASTMRPSR